jgi:hypothetical protein
MLHSNNLKVSVGQLYTVSGSEHPVLITEITVGYNGDNHSVYVIYINLNNTELYSHIC